MHQPHYLPWLRYIHKLASSDVFVILDDVQFTKNGWQNRNKIKGAQGPVCLTVPVRDPAFKPINAVEIDAQSAWREKHWKSLLFTYSKAPFFRRFGPVFEQALAEPWERLAPLNCHLIRALCQGFGIRTSLVLSSTLEVQGASTERLVRICQVLGADRYLTGAYAMGNHMDERMFGNCGISVEIQAWECPQYRQQFPGVGFLPDLSGVDLLFNEGPGGLRLLLGGASDLVSIGTQRMFG
jgi:hypothetical protein